MDWPVALQVLQIASMILGPGAFGLALATWLRMRPQMKLAEVKAEELHLGRIAALEQKLDDSDKACAARIERVEKRHADDVGKLTDRHETVIAVLEAHEQVARHDRNNWAQGLKSMFVMLKRIDHPEIPAIVADVEEMIAKGEEAVAKERAAIPVLKGRMKV